MEDEDDPGMAVLLEQEAAEEERRSRGPAGKKLFGDVVVSPSPGLMFPPLALRKRPRDEDAGEGPARRGEPPCPVAHVAKRKRTEIQASGDVLYITTSSGEKRRATLREEEEDPLDVLRRLQSSSDVPRASRVSEILQACDRRRYTASSSSLSSNIARRGDAPQGGAVLLTDKYRPKAYTDLLTDERLNRELLQWMRSFGPGQASASVTPMHKAVILCGGPGVGKSTLAHVLAKQAGFRAVEINASDERRKEEFERRLLDAVCFDSVVPGAPPNMLVIDEIDGICSGPEGKGAVDALLRLLGGGREAPKKEKEDRETGDKKKEDPKRKHKGKKGGIDAVVLRRPIICICNDVYVPALRELRKICKVYTVSKPSVIRLSDTLKKISKEEHVPVDGSAISALCEISSCDIREALNILELVKLNSREESGSSVITGDTVRQLAVGEKDTESSLFDLWETLFSPTSPGGDALFAEVDRRGTASGDLEKVLDGCWLNFPRLGYSDHLMTKTLSCAEWLSHADSMAGREGHAGFLAGEASSSPSMLHTAPAILSFHAVLAGVPHRVAGSQIVFPKAHSVMWKKRRQHQNLQDEFLAGLPASLRRSVFPLEDYLSCLATVLAPPLRSVNQRLMTEMERETLARLASLLSLHSLRFKTGGAAATDRMQSASLEPPLEDLIAYGDSATIAEANSDFSAFRHSSTSEVQPAVCPPIKERRVLPVVLKKLVDQEARNLTWKTAEGLRLQNAAKKPVSPAPAAKAPSKSLAPKTIKSPEGSGQKRDFFGRTVCHNARSTALGSAPPTAAAPLVRFKFQEGFTNAVKRKLRVKDFM